MQCDRCSRKPDGIAYTCGRCSGRFCEDHRLPEAHQCPAISAEKARQLSGAEPWFKDEFRLSNVEDKEPAATSRERRRGEDSPTVAATCETCGMELLEHEIAGCPYCGDPYCGAHVAAHRSECDDAPTPAADTNTDSTDAESSERPPVMDEPDRPGSDDMQPEASTVRRVGRWVLEKLGGE